MPLVFDASWRFEAPPGKVPYELMNEFSTLIVRIATHRPGQSTLEHFKSYFAADAGTTSARSSDVGWAQSDLNSYMQQASLNVPLFIEAFFDGCEAFRRQGVAVPDVRLINRLIAESEVPYRIDPPELVFTGQEVAPVAVQNATPSLDKQALEVLHNAISTSEQMLAEGKGRQAVQEILWVLETIATAFRGLDTDTLSANVRETRSTQRIRVGRRQRKRTCWDCEREWKRMVVPLEPGRPSEARQLLRTQR